MSDLISRSALLKEIEKYKFGAISNDTEREYVKTTILNFIECQPIAYSVEGVAHELSKLKDANISNCDNWLDKIYGYCKQCDRTMLVDKAIEIVKGGGMSAVCEEEFEEVE